MTEINLKKRYPHSRDEDITDAFMRGYQEGYKAKECDREGDCDGCKFVGVPQGKARADRESCGRGHKYQLRREAEAEHS